MHVRGIVRDSPAFDPLPQALLKERVLEVLAPQRAERNSSLAKTPVQIQHTNQAGPVGNCENWTPMRKQSSPQVTAVLPHRFGHHECSIGMDALEDIHAHALAIDEAMLQGW